MKPINKKDRSKAFYRVVGLFLVSFAIAMVLGFTTMNIQKFSNTKSNKDLENLQDQLKFQEEVFAPAVDTIAAMMAKVPTHKEEGINIDVLHSDIASKLSSTKNQVVQDESWESFLYLNVIQSLSNLQVALKDKDDIQEQLDNCLNSSSGAGDQVARLIADNDRLQKQVDQLSSGSDNTEQINDLNKKLREAQQKLSDCELETKALLSQIEKLKK